MWSITQINITIWLSINYEKIYNIDFIQILRNYCLIAHSSYLSLRNKSQLALMDFIAFRFFAHTLSLHKYHKLQFTKSNPTILL